MFGIDPLAELQESANAVFPWLVSARRLLQSALLLDKHSEVGDLYKDVRNVARMCSGMAIECYFKAYFVACGNEIHDGKSQKKLGSHDLAAMAKCVGFAVTTEQERVLHYLSMWVRVKGCYPVPLKPEDMSIHPDDKDAYPSSEHMLVWDDRSDDVCMEIVREAESRINVALSGRADR